MNNNQDQGDNVTNTEPQVGDIWRYSAHPSDYDGPIDHIVINCIGRTKYGAVCLTDPTDNRVIMKQNLNQYWQKVS